jgi:outer membrane protein OmpA-like peptidoglycan-associated protein
MLLTLADDELRFRTAQATLPAGELPSLDRIATLLKDFPKLTARIEGHTDSSGRDETNLELSQERANAVKAALEERGVASDRLIAEGVGEARPIADNATPTGRRENRRVEVYVLETP